MEQDEDTFIPECNEELKPRIGKTFKTLNKAKSFYIEYARAGGFDPRKSTSRIKNGLSLHRAIICSREGSKFIVASNGGESFEALNNRRKRTSSRCGCKAKVFFKFVSGIGYVVPRLVEGHNHSLVEPKHKHFMKVNRNIDEMHQRFIIDCAKASIGATHAYKLMTEFLGGPCVGCTLTESVGCTLTESVGCTLKMARHDSRNCDKVNKSTDDGDI